MSQSSETTDKKDPKARSEENRYIVRSVDKALRLLELIAESPSAGISLGEASSVLGTSKSTVFSLFRTLEMRGFVRETPVGHRYQLGTALLWLGDTAERNNPLVGLAHDVIQDLTNTTGMTSRLAISDGGFPIFLDRMDGPGTVQFHTALGRRELPHTSAAGKAILSHMEDAEVQRLVATVGMPARTERTITTITALLDDLAVTKARGYALDDEEDAVGVFCVSAGFLDRSGECVGAISATGIKQGVSDQQVKEIGSVVRAHADVISARLGHHDG